MKWWEQLDHKRRSQPRCVLVMDGSREEVAQRLTTLANLPDVLVSPENSWMPRGKPTRSADETWDKTPAKEAKLGDPSELLPEEVQQELKNWWLAITNRANTPNWDIASTCDVGGRSGLLLVEAKAHHSELQDAKSGMKPGGNEQNRERIGACIAEANRELWRETRVDWRLSRDSHYQMSNRFAWSWKLNQFGYPVVLVYLGFANATEMVDRGRLINDHGDWDTAVYEHSRSLFPVSVWGREWIVNGCPLIPLVRVLDQPFVQDEEAVA